MYSCSSNASRIENKLKAVTWTVGTRSIFGNGALFLINKQSRRIRVYALSLSGGLSALIGGTQCRLGTMNPHLFSVSTQNAWLTSRKRDKWASLCLRETRLFIGDLRYYGQSPRDDSYSCRPAVDQWQQTHTLRLLFTCVELLYWRTDREIASETLRFKFTVFFIRLLCERCLDGISETVVDTKFITFCV